MSDKMRCKVCEKYIDEGEKVITLELGDMEYHTTPDDDEAWPINQSSESKGYWHEGCFPEGIIKE